MKRVGKVIFQRYPKSLSMKRSKVRKYYEIAIKEGKEEALKAIEYDHAFGLLDSKLYKHLMKAFEKIKDAEPEQSNKDNLFHLLFAKLLVRIYHEPIKFSVEDLQNWFGLELETAKEFVNWLKSHPIHYDILNIVRNVRSSKLSPSSRPK